MLKFAPLGILCLLTSASYQAPADSRVGQSAPYLKLTSGEFSTTLDALKGDYVLLSFWDSADPQSRINNMQNDRAATENGKYIHVSVNLDESRGVWEQMVITDGLTPFYQFHVEAGNRDEVASVWRLQEGCHSYLIDPQGQIIAIDPEAGLELTALTNG